MLLPLHSFPLRSTPLSRKPGSSHGSNQMRLLDLIGPDLAEREAVLCFSWSRMAVVDSGTVKGRLKSCRLPFEGYMEVDVKSTHLTL